MGARDGAYETPQESPAAAATRPWPDQEAQEAKRRLTDQTLRYTASNSAELMSIETPGVVVEPRRRCRNF